VNASAFRTFVCALIIVGLVACAQPGTPDRETSTTQVDLGSSIEWAAVDGAVEYRVQLWDGTRLLFEEERELTSLPVTPVMERSLLGVSRAELQVRALGADGRQIGELQRRRYPVDAG